MSTWSRVSPAGATARSAELGGELDESGPNPQRDAEVARLERLLIVGHPEPSVTDPAHQAEADRDGEHGDQNEHPGKRDIHEPREQLRLA